MAAASVAFKTREDHRKQIELKEARKVGLTPAEVDEDEPSLKHQWKRKSDQGDTKSWYDRGAEVFQAEIYRKGACQNCGAITHDAKSCVERPRKVGAKMTNKHIAPDEKIEAFKLDYEGKRDPWDGYDTSSYAHAVERYEARDATRRKFLKEQQQLKQLDEKDSNHDLRIDEAKVDESKQKDSAKVEKRVRTTNGGSTGTVRNLCTREDIAKYLLNLDVNSAHYDPKTHSMRDDPLPDADPNEKFYLGDNRYRNSGQALEFKQLSIHAHKGQDIHMQAAPSQAELLYKNHKVINDKSKDRRKDTIMEKYGSAASEEEIPRELLLGQSERQVEYDGSGCVIKGQVRFVKAFLW